MARPRLSAATRAPPSALAQELARDHAASGRRCAAARRLRSGAYSDQPEPKSAVLEWRAERHRDSKKARVEALHAEKHPKLLLTSHRTSSGEKSSAFVMPDNALAAAACRPFEEGNTTSCEHVALTLGSRCESCLPTASTLRSMADRPAQAAATTWGSRPQEVPTGFTSRLQRKLSQYNSRHLPRASIKKKKKCQHLSISDFQPPRPQKASQPSDLKPNVQALSMPASFPSREVTWKAFGPWTLQLQKRTSTGQKGAYPMFGPLTQVVSDSADDLLAHTSPGEQTNLEITRHRQSGAVPASVES